MGKTKIIANININAFEYIMEKIVLIALVIAALAFIFWLISSQLSQISLKRKEYYQNFVKTHSLAIKELEQANSRYNIKKVKNTDFTYVYDNIKFYNQITCEDYLIYQLQYKEKEIKQRFLEAEKHIANYAKYIDETKKITQFGHFDVAHDNLNYEELIKIEKELFKSLTIVINPSIYVSVTLKNSDMNGYIHDSRTQHFNKDKVLHLSKRLSNKNGTFFNDKEIWNSISKVERGKVSNKLRFSIYKRDNNRCRRCGVHRAYEDLEIDHIIPISKGGKSTYDNLQTLCHRCNVEKGSSLQYK